MINSSESLARRAVLAVFLTIGFYLLALATVAILLYIPYAEVVYAHRIHLQLTIGCLVGAVVIAWSIIPRPDRFVAPGPRLLPEDQPELFDILRVVSGQMKQEMPNEVYALAELNAWVMNRGGIMGFGSRRVMGIGLPLMQVLSVSQVRGVIAHEFGHFYGGDTKLGPWIYRTRSAIFRTLSGLAEHGSLVQKPFIWYGNLFMRITQSISRNQEYTADRLAAEIVGSQAMINGLCAIHGSGAVYDAFWRNEYAPVINKGYRPPLTGGFDLMMRSPRVAGAVEKIVTEALESGDTDPYDSHPSLRDRVSALQKLDIRREQNNVAAISLLRSPENLEESLLMALGGPSAISRIESINWDQVGMKVWLPIWQEHVENNREMLQKISARELPEILSDPKEKLRLLTGTAALDENEQNSFLTGVIGAALSLILVNRGWSLNATPGDDVVLSHEGEDVLPFLAVRELLDGEKSGNCWQNLCNAVQGDVVLGAA